jgi:hypothetical protein
VTINCRNCKQSSKKSEANFPIPAVAPLVFLFLQEKIIMRAIISFFVYSILFLLIFIALGAFSKHDFSALRSAAEAAPAIPNAPKAAPTPNGALPQQTKAVTQQNTAELTFCEQAENLSLTIAACPNDSAAQNAALALYNQLSRERAQALQAQIEQAKKDFETQQQSRLALLADLEKKIALNESAQAEVARLKQQQTAFEAEDKMIQAIQSQERARRLEQQLRASNLETAKNAFYTELRTWNYPGTAELAVDNDRADLRAWLDTPFNRFQNDQTLLTQALQNGGFMALENLEGKENIILQQLKKFTFNAARDYQLPELQAVLQSVRG